ncbi:MAG: hypothetical protein GXY98_05705 [Erysipelothrix sp.]|nr:hypothetical protein [Erysipelothrix sp.]
MIVLEIKKNRQMISSLSKNKGLSMTTQELLQQLQIEEHELKQLVDTLVENHVVVRKGESVGLNSEGYRKIVQNELPVVWGVVEKLKSIYDRISSVSVYNSPSLTDLSTGTIIIITDTDSEKLIYQILQETDLDQYKILILTKSQLLQFFEANKEDINKDNQLEILL